VILLQGMASVSEADVSGKGGRINIVFDLDGTLTNPESGITRCMVYAVERLGIAVPVSCLRRYIGPPRRAAFGELLIVRHFRLSRCFAGVYGAALSGRIPTRQSF
jgi:phosphoglycolate phosphatase-like HAD superfamily hydrolase